MTMFDAVEVYLVKTVTTPYRLYANWALGHA